MKLIKVKCPKNKKVEVEELPTRAARCPAHCPLKQKNKCFNNTFRYNAVLSDAVVPDIPYAADATSAQATAAAKPTAAANATANASAAAGTRSTPRTAAPTRGGTRREAPVRGATRREAPVRGGASRTAVPSAATPSAAEQTPATAQTFAAEQAPAAFSSRFGYREELFASEAETAAPDVIEMGDVFGDPEPAAPAVADPVPPSFERRNKTLDKYNEVLADADSLFARVKRRNPDEPCFEDGALVFYEGVRDGRSAGNAQAALRHIFSHWYVSRVFDEDEKTLREDFLGLLALRGFRSSEEQIRAICEDPTLDVNHKFFRLFYRVIYRNQINGFYWHEGDSIHRKVVPHFTDLKDFYDRLAYAPDPTAFLSKFDSCMDELITFLRAGEDGADNREWFMNTIPRLVAEQKKNVCCVRQCPDGKLEMINLGRISDFVGSMPKPDTLERLEERIAFLERFEITATYHVRLRTEPLAISQRQGMEDDSVYDSVGLTHYETSQCATAYNKYITLLKEYIRVFRPEQLFIGAYRFTARSFYTEVMDIIATAGAHLSEENAADAADSRGFYLLKSLFARGVFEYYEMLCETEKLQALKQNFIEHDRISLEMYFRLENIVHTVYINGGKVTVSDYLTDLIGDDARDDVRRLTAYLRGEDPVLQAYFRARISQRDEREAMANIERLIVESASNARL